MKNTAIHNFAITALIALLAAPICWGAKAPISDADREKESSHILTGRIVAVSSKIQKSDLEKGAGNKDQIFTIKVKVESTTKGEGVRIGEEIQVVAWKPHTRTGIAKIGLQGQEQIPKKGQSATFYLKLNEKIYKPLMPNGIDIHPHAEKKLGETAHDNP